MTRRTKPTNPAFQVLYLKSLIGELDEHVKGEGVMIEYILHRDGSRATIKTIDPRTYGDVEVLYEDRPTGAVTKALERRIRQYEQQRFGRLFRQPATV